MERSPLSRAADKIRGFLKKPPASLETDRPTSHPLDRRIGRRTALAAIPVLGAALTAIATGEVRPVAAETIDETAKPAEGQRTAAALSAPEAKARSTAEVVQPRVAVAESVGVREEPVVENSGNGAVDSNGTLPPESPPNLGEQPPGQPPADGETLGADPNTGKELGQSEDIKGAPAVESAIVDLADFTKEAIDSRLEELKDLEVMWDAQGKSPKFTDKEREEAAYLFKMLIAIYKPAPGVIGKGAIMAEKFIRGQNNPSTRGPQQFLYRSTRFIGAVMPTISTSTDLNPGNAPINFIVGNNLVIVGNSVKSEMLIVINPTFLPLVTGEARLVDGRKDLAAGEQFAYVFTYMDLLNKSLQKQTSDFLKSEQKTSMADLQDHLQGKFSDSRARAKADADRLALESTRQLYQAMPDYWYVNDSLSEHVR